MGEAESSADAVQFMLEDESRSNHHGFWATGHERHQGHYRGLWHSPQTPLLIVSVYDEEDVVLSAIRSGVRGFLSKRVSSGDLLDALRNMAQLAGLRQADRAHVERRTDDNQRPATLLTPQLSHESIAITANGLRAEIQQHGDLLAGFSIRDQHPDGAVGRRYALETRFKPSGINSPSVSGQGCMQIYFGVALFPFPGGRQHRLAVILVIRAGCLLSLRPLFLANSSRPRIASAICSRSWRNPASICATNIPSSTVPPEHSYAPLHVQPAYAGDVNILRSRT